MMELNLFSEGDIKTYKLEDLKGKTLDIIAAGENEGVALIYGRDVITGVIHVIGANSFKHAARREVKDVQIDTFDNVDFRELKAPIIVVYEHPKDYPNCYVARVWDCEKPTNVIVLSDDLEGIRRMRPPWMVQMKSSYKDDKCIVETWL